MDSRRVRRIDAVRERSDLQGPAVEYGRTLHGTQCPVAVYRRRAGARSHAACWPLDPGRPVAGDYARRVDDTRGHTDGDAPDRQWGPDPSGVDRVAEDVERI